MLGIASKGPRLLRAAFFGSCIVYLTSGLAQADINQIPQPPAPLIPFESAIYYFYFNCLLTSISFGFLAWEAWRTRSAFPLAFFVAGAISVFVEPIYDGNTHVWFAQPQSPMNTSYNIAYPWYAMFGMTTMGGGIYWMCREFERGVSTRALWGYFVLWGMYQVILEVPGNLTNSYIYYGPHPFRFLGFPMWLALCLSVGFPMTGYFVHRLRQVMTGFGLWLMTVAMIPIVLFGSFLVTWPMWVSLNGGRGPVEMKLAALLCLGLSIAAYHCLVLFYAKEREQGQASA